MSEHCLRVRLPAGLALLMLAVACGGCEPPPRTPPTAIGTTPEAPTAGVLPPLGEPGQLQVFVTSQMTDGRNIQLRGLIRNPYPDAIEGVRVLVRILSAVDPGARELDRFQKVLDEHLASGQRTALRLDLQTMYANSGAIGFSVQAFAIKRAGQEFPPPPDWKE